MTRSFLIFCTMFLLLFVTLSNAQDVTKIVEQTAAGGTYELLKDWRIISLLAIFITSILVAIAYAAGIAFDAPDLKGWASVELSQVIANALIIAFIIGVLSFLDFGVDYFLKNSNIPMPPCVGTSTCALTAANIYIDGLVDLGIGNAYDFAESAGKAAQEAAKRYGVSCNMFLIPPCLFAGSSFSTTGNNMLDVERFTFLMEHNNNILSSLYAQKFFVGQVAYKMGPILLLLGIVGRSFFVTRRLGGLLIAIAVGIMFVFPMMYIFNWITMNVVIMGDKLFGDVPDQLGCPAVCKQLHPLAVYNNEPMDYKKAIEVFGIDNANKLKGGDISWMPAEEKQKLKKGTNGKEIVCNSKYSPASLPECPEKCRYVPYPMEADIGNLNYSFTQAELQCSDPKVHDACAYYPSECFVATVVWDRKDKSLDPSQAEVCPEKCRIVPPLSSECHGSMHFTDVHAHEGGCFVNLWGSWKARFSFSQAMCISTFLTKFANMKSTTDLYWDAPDYKYIDYDDDSGWFDCTEDLWIHCNFRNNTYFISYYKVDDKGGKYRYFPTGDYDYQNTWDSNDYTTINTYKYDGSGISFVYLPGMDPLLFDFWWPMNPSDPRKNCVYLVPYDTTGCDKCNFIEDQYKYEPVTYTDCQLRCSGAAQGKFSISPDEFARMTAEKMYGRSEVISVSQLIIPAYFLPLLAIAVTVMFIKSLSQILGGDIEIPGLPKVF